ncbi:MAG: asparaginase [Candidatus Latescibacteria bacterium]|nr:asparaginase [Candidatus Latescibacterota bacterium]
MAIRIFTTGGTFDKEYDEIKGRLFFKHTQVPEMLRLGRSRLKIKMSSLMMVDSLEMTQAHRETIIRHCQKTQEERILIIHGTDTMAKTAQVLGKRIRNKTIVLTGAIIPYKFGSSDGLFNLGSSLAFVQTLPHGVYISMNGKWFVWHNVKKNKQTGEFEKIR